MATKGEIICFLKEIGELDGDDTKLRDEGETLILDVSTDKAAHKGSLAWMSKKVLSEEPGRLKNFLGSLLIAPRSVELKGVDPSRVAECRNPKLAFIKVVKNFFSHLSITEWPKMGERPVHENSRIGERVSICAGVVIGSGVTIEDDVFVGPNTVIANSTIKRNVTIGANCSIGFPGFGFDRDEKGNWWRFPHMGRVVIEENAEIGSNTCVDRGSIGETRIGFGAKIDNLVHIAHNVIVGAHSLVIANSMLGGSAVLGENVWVAPSVSVMNQVSVADRAFLGMGAVVNKSVEEAAVMVGNPAKSLRKRGSEW